jgi:two-component system sensor histidine kinase KdpD
VSVIDEGPGLSSEDLVHVFDRFYRSKKTSNSVKGTGLGLFLCKAIIEAHGGEMRVDNRTDRSGAVFSFSLPIKLSKEEKSQLIDLSL